MEVNPRIQYDGHSAVFESIVKIDGSQSSAFTCFTIFGFESIVKIDGSQSFDTMRDYAVVFESIVKIDGSQSR